MGGFGRVQVGSGGFEWDRTGSGGFGNKAQNDSPEILGRRDERRSQRHATRSPMGARPEIPPICHLNNQEGHANARVHTYQQGKANIMIDRKF